MKTDKEKEYEEIEDFIKTTINLNKDVFKQSGGIAPTVFLLCPRENDKSIIAVVDVAPLFNGKADPGKLEQVLAPVMEQLEPSCYL